MSSNRQSVYSIDRELTLETISSIFAFDDGWMKISFGKQVHTWYCRLTGHYRFGALQRDIPCCDTISCVFVRISGSRGVPTRDSSAQRSRVSSILE